MIFDRIIRILAQTLSFVVLVDIVLSYFMSPYHPIRSTLDRVVEPLLKPIRRLLPATLGIDLSPVILIILIEVVQFVLMSIF